jgi:hypothetical protein
VDDVEESTLSWLLSLQDGDRYSSTARAPRGQRGSQPPLLLKVSSTSAA